jgi:DNA-binding NarL/FixJ family response regulator
MPRLNGARAAVQVRASYPGVRIVALTMHESRGYLRELLSAGASGYVLKRSAANELVHAIRSVAQGGTYVDPSLAGKLTEHLTQPSPSGFRDGDLSERELEVLRLIAHGYSNKEIAAQLGVSVKSVETYKTRAMEKLELGSRVDIVRYALHRNWLQPS